MSTGRRWSLGLALPLLLATAGAAGGTVIGAASGHMTPQ